ncbi:MAG: hypothetical protein ACKPKO_20455, partial [Candidatus Fonsibacter sp.]
EGQVVEEVKNKRYISLDYQLSKMLKRRKSTPPVFTHVSNKVMLYSNTYEPDERELQNTSYTTKQ